jgi:hypothetical protein
MNRRFIFALVFVLILATSSIGAIIYFSGRTSTPSPLPPQTDPYVADFDSCMRAGNPIQESYPRRCSTPDGRSFTEIIEPDQKSMEGDLQTLNTGSFFGLKNPSQKVITTQAELDKLWKDLQAQTSQDILLKPRVDFKNQVVLGVFAGPKGSGGHSIKIQSVTPINNNGKYRVQVEETRPGDNCTSTSVMTYPFHIVAYTFDKPSSASAPLVEWAPPSAKDFRFVTNTRVNNCFAD